MICICTLLMRQKMYRGAWWYDFDVSFSVSAYLFMVSLCSHFTFLLHSQNSDVSGSTIFLRICRILFAKNKSLSSYSLCQLVNFREIESTFLIQQWSCHFYLIIKYSLHSHSLSSLIFSSISHCQKYFHKMVTILVSHPKSSSSSHQ